MRRKRLIAAAAGTLLAAAIAGGVAYATIPSDTDARPRIPRVSLRYPGRDRRRASTRRRKTHEHGSALQGHDKPAGCGAAGQLASLEGRRLHRPPADRALRPGAARLCGRAAARARATHARDRPRTATGLSPVAMRASWKGQWPVPGLGSPATVRAHNHGPSPAADERAATRPSDTFDCGDAGVGAGLTVVLGLLVAGGALVLSPRRGAVDGRKRPLSARVRGAPRGLRPDFWPRSALSLALNGSGRRGCWA